MWKNFLSSVPGYLLQLSYWVSILPPPFPLKERTSFIKKEIQFLLKYQVPVMSQKKSIYKEPPLQEWVKDPCSEKIIRF